jgi:hypothetical protein
VLRGRLVALAHSSSPSLHHAPPRTGTAPSRHLPCKLPQRPQDGTYGSGNITFNLDNNNNIIPIKEATLEKEMNIKIELSQDEIKSVIINPDKNKKEARKNKKFFLIKFLNIYFSLKCELNYLYNITLLVEIFNKMS